MGLAGWRRRENHKLCAKVAEQKFTFYGSYDSRPSLPPPVSVSVFLLHPQSAGCFVLLVVPLPLLWGF